MSMPPVCACCPTVENPPGYSMSEDGMEFSEKDDLDLQSPHNIKFLDKDLHNSNESVAALASNYGCSSSFKVLSKGGLEKLKSAVDDMHQHVVNTPRYAAVRGATFRNKFLHGLSHSQALLDLVSRLAGCELLYHPMRIHQLHINFMPKDESSRHVDKWHCDTTPFVLVLFATNPDNYEGGALEYYEGTREEGTSLFKQGKPLPKSRILRVGKQLEGYGVFMQGSRVYHQVTPVTRGNERTTLVFSFQPKNPLAKEPLDKLAQTYNERDPLYIMVPEWARFHAWKSIRRFEVLREHDLLFDSRLEDAINKCTPKLNEILTKLPYQLDRDGIKKQLEEAIQALKLWLISYSIEGDDKVKDVVDDNSEDSSSSSSSSKKKKRRIVDWEDDNCIDNCHQPKSRHGDEKHIVLSRFMDSPYGHNNLKRLVLEVENCMDCVATIAVGAMEYY